MKESAPYNPDDDVYDFQLIEFITRGPKTNRSTDIVPSFWVEFNKKNGKLFTKFLPPPYTADATAVLEHYVRARLQPMDSWNSYNIKLIGQSRTYEEGIKKLKLLRNDDTCVYSAGTDFCNASQKAEYITQKFKERSLQQNFPPIPAPKLCLTRPSAYDSSGMKEKIQSAIKDRKKSSKTKSKGKSLKLQNHIKEKILTSSLSSLSSDSDNSWEKKELKEKSRKRKRPVEHENSSKVRKIIDGDELSNLNNEKVSNIEDPLRIQQDYDNYSNYDLHMNVRNLPSGSDMNDSKSELNDSSVIKNISYLKSNKTVDKDMKYLLSSLKGYGILLQEISNRLDSQEAILRTLSREKGLPTVNSMTCDLGLNLPFNDIVEFTEFNTKLEDQKFREDFITSLHFLLDTGGNVSKSVLNILKKLFTRDFACKFTNIKQMPKKYTLNKFKIHQCIKGAIMRTQNENGSAIANEKKIVDAIGNVLAGVRDWDGGRKEREIAKQAENNNNNQITEEM
ncbi:uncharacterized protein LOC122513014 [Leptopilina heterotoma]|uniref:uncharacterized protein LOC122513014 n=1 Tax=Leptopilina heterotoma TaxID=63436 RepID=UPI001CA81348|nr:uncharacterized protein LOC122513014 [Leptopilina heterotoma]